MFKKNFKKLLLIHTLLISLVLTGCWDKMEIDERSFVLALGIDHLPPEEQPSQKEMIGVIKRDNHYNVTYVFPKQMGGLAETEVGKIAMSSVGENIFLTQQQLLGRTDTVLGLGHLKTVVISEVVARNSKMFREVLDALEKDPRVSRKIGFAVVEGEAKEALAVEPKLEPITGLYLNDLFRKRDRTPRAPRGDLNDILISLHNDGNAVIPRLNIANEELKLGGAAVINNYEMVGWLGEIETLALMILRDEIDMWYVTIEDEGINFPYEVTDSSSEFKLIEKNNQLKIQIKIEMEGDIKQYIYNPPKDLLDPEYLAKLESEINERIVAAAEHIVDVLQQDLATDVLEIGQYLRKYHPKTWEQVKEDWQNVFPTVEIEVLVDAKIRRIGLSR